jgi:hypothetical protein
MNITPHNIPAVRSDEFLRKHVAILCDQPSTLARHEELFLLLEVAYIMGRTCGVHELATALRQGTAAPIAA